MAEGRSSRQGVAALVDLIGEGEDWAGAAMLEMSVNSHKLNSLELLKGVLCG